MTATMTVISSLFAGIVSVFITWSIERFGGVIGGVLSSSPTTVVCLSIGLASTASMHTTRESLYAVPIGMSINCLFLLLWRELPERLPYVRNADTIIRKVSYMTATTLSIWLVLATLSVLFLTALKNNGVPSLAPGLVFFGCCIAIGVFGVLTRELAVIKAKKPTSRAAYIFRFSAAGTSIFPIFN